MRILIAHEKYKDRYFDASSQKDLAKACLKLLTERLKAGYWGYEPEKLSRIDVMSESVIAMLPEKYQEMERNKQISYKRELAEYQYQLDWFDQVKKCVKEKSLDLNNLGVPITYNLLRDRTDNEYERISLEQLEEV